MSTRAFAPHEWLIAVRYLRARRSEGGVSGMTWISLIGVSLAVFALIATLAVRAGFRTEFVTTILGANAHASIYWAPLRRADGVIERTNSDYERIADSLRQVPTVIRVAPVVKGQVLASANGRSAGVQILGETLDDLRTLPLIANPETRIGSLDDFDKGIAIGTGVARTLGLALGDRVTLTSPDGVKTAFGTSPRVKAYDVTYIFGVGRYDIDQVRVYMPLAEAQSFFNREGAVDELEIMIEDPDRIDEVAVELRNLSGERALAWTWRDANGNFLRALKMEDNIMFIILSILVLIASMNIVSGLIMLVKNKGRDVGILRTMGLTQGSIMRIFFICGASIGVVGTCAGVVMGCLFAIYIDPIFGFVNYMAGGGVWDPSIRLISNLPARLVLSDVLSAVTLSLGLSFLVTVFPARRAARLDPVEALRYE